MPIVKRSADGAGNPVRELGNPANAALSGPELELKYFAIFEQASDAIVMVDAFGRIENLNQAAENLTGYVKTELQGNPWSLLMPRPGEHRLPLRSRALSEDLLEQAGTYEDIAFLRKDGYVGLVDISLRTVAGSRVALLRDTSERKRLERELITQHAELRAACHQLEKKNAELETMQATLVQAGKMAALGELAAGIAHELNQPLQGIRGYAQELQALRETPVGASVPTTPDDAATFLHEIVSNVDKMAGIIGYLRTFTRKSVENHEFTSVHHAIEESLKMLARQFASRGIVVERSFAESLPEVYANPLQLEQVFINLATNARDAIEATGRGGGQVKIQTRAAEKFVEIRFEDNGCGMADGTRSKAFNPFFTTKEVGKGMGLGLSLSYGMINRLHGSIVVESELGKGTVFTVRVPRDFRELG